MTKKQKIKRLTIQLLFYCYRVLLCLKIVKPKILIKMDGGISSQMHQYLLGRIYSEKGYIVKYDLSFFKYWGKDNYGQFERNFDLLKAFPYLTFKQANEIESMIYSSYFVDTTVYLDHEGEDFFLYDIEPPKYLGGYYRSPQEMWKNMFPKYFHIDPQVLDSRNYSLYEDINKKDHAVGVHVRRGDLKDFNNAYGNPADFEYFNKAVSYFYTKIETPFFYFFSDEPQWVKDELVEKLPIENTQYKIVTGNGSNKGYMDLFLLAGCAHQITSKGSFGKFGALLRDSKDKIVVLNNDPVEYIWKERLLNPVYL